MPSPDEIHARFAHHPPQTEARIKAHESVRALSESLAQSFLMILPNCRETSLAMTAIQEASMWANAALAIHGDARYGEDDNT